MILGKGGCCASFQTQRNQCCIFSPQLGGKGGKFPPISERPKFFPPNFFPLFLRSRENFPPPRCWSFLCFNLRNEFPDRKQPPESKNFPPAAPEGGISGLKRSKTLISPHFSAGTENFPPFFSSISERPTIFPPCFSPHSQRLHATLVSDHKRAQ